MKYVRFYALPKTVQKELDNKTKSYGWNLPEGWTHDPDFLVETCRKCGRPATLCEVLLDTPAPCEGRDVTIRCSCGRTYTYGA